MKHTWKITYPDGEIEFWHDAISDVVPELARLQKIHNGVLVSIYTILK